MAKDCIDFNSIASIIKVERPKGDLKIDNKDKGKKPYKFDTHAIKHYVMYDLLAGDGTKGENGPFKQIMDAVKNNNVIKKLTGAQRIVNVKNNPLLDDLIKIGMTREQKNIAGQRMQIRGIAMKHIIGSMNSEKDVEDKLNLSAEDKNNLKEDGVRNISTVGMATAMGREIAYSMGFKLKGADSNHINAFYNKMGVEAMKEIEKNTELLTLDTDAFILNNKYMKSTHERVSSDLILPGHDIVRINMDKLIVNKSKLTAEELNDLFEEGGSIEMKARRDPDLELAGVVDATQRYIGRMSVPSNLQNPDTTPNEVSEKDIHMTTLTRETLQEMQEKETFVNPKLSKFFLHLNKMVKEKMEDSGDYGTKADFQSILSSEFSNDHEVLTDIFGELDKRAPEDNKDQAVGQSLSKTNTLQTMIEMADQFFNDDGSPKPLFFTHEMYRNGRVGFLETTLNAQTDKFFSRYATTGGEVEVEINSDEYQHLLRGIEDDAGFGLADDFDGTAIDLIRGTRNHPGLDLALDGYRKAFMDDTIPDKKAFKLQKAFMISLAQGAIYTGEKKNNSSGLSTYIYMSGSIWQKLAVLEGIVDVHDAKDGIISTNFQTKPDATGSGIVLQLLQMMGLDGMDGAMDKLNDLGLIKKGEKVLKDVYKFLENAIENDKNEATGDDKRANELIHSMKDFEFFYEIRDIVKPTTMITSYMAGFETVIEQSGKAYAEAIIKKLNDPYPPTIVNGKSSTEFVLDLLKEMATKKGASKAEKEFYAKHIEDKKLDARELANIPGVKGHIQSYLSETAGKYSAELIQEALISGSMSKFQNKMKKLYANMEAIFKHNERLIAAGEDIKAMELRVLPAQVVLDIYSNPNHKDFKDKTHRQLLKDFGIPIMSASQMMIGGKPPIVMKNTMNALTALVSVIHSMDSAIIFNSHRETMKRIKEEMALLKKSSNPEKSFRYKQLKAISKMASHSVHDANNANPVYNTIFEKVYREQTEFAVQHYDMYDQMVKSYEVYHNWDERNTSGVSDGRSNKEDNELKDMKDEAERSLKFKENFKLNYESDNIFGFKEGLPEVTEKNLEPATVPKTESIANTSELEEDITAEKEVLAEMNEKMNDRKRDLKRYNAAIKEWYESNNNQAKPRNLAPSEITEKDIGKQKKLIERLETKLDRLKPKEEVDMSTPFDEGEGFAKFSGESKTANKDFDDLMDEMQDEVDASVERKKRGETDEQYKARERIHFDNMKRALKYWIKHSPNIIGKFFTEIKRQTGKPVFHNLAFGNEFSYIAKDHRITIPNIASLETPIGVYAMEHEIMHMKTVGYMAANPKDKHVRIINEAVDNIDNYKDVLLELTKDNPFIQQRLHYAFSGPKTQLRAELVAVLGSEKEVAKRFIKEMSKIRKQMTNMEMVHKPNTDYGRLVLAAKSIYNTVKNIRFQNLDIDPQELVDAIYRVGEQGNDWNNSDNDIAKEGRREHIRKRATEDGFLDKDGYVIDKKTGKSTDRNIANESLSFAKKTNKQRAEDRNKKKANPKKILKDSTYYDHTESYKIDPEASKSVIPGIRQWNTINNYAGSYTRNFMDESLEPLLGKGVDKADEYLSKQFPVYKRTRNIVTDYWNSADWLQSQKGYLDRARSGDLFALNKLETIQMNAHQEATRIQNQMISETNDLMEKANLNDIDKADLSRTMTYAPIFHLVNQHGDFKRILSAADPLAEIDILLEEVSKGLSKQNINKVKKLAKVLAKKQDVDTGFNSYYNIAEMGITDGNKETIERLTALQTLLETDGSKNGLSILAANPTLADNLSLMSVSLKEITESMLNGLSNDHDRLNFRENLIYEQFENPVEFRAVDARMLKSKEFSKAKGWKVLRHPKSDTYGVIYRDRSKTTTQAGAGTTVDFRTYDIMVDSTIKGDNNKVMKGATNVHTRNGVQHKVVLTQEELSKIPGLLNNPADSLVRAYSQALIAKNTQAARDYITFGGKIDQQNIADARSFDKKVNKMKPKDRPWFIKIPADMTFDEFEEAHPGTMLHYKMPENTSRIDGFDQQFELVRKDLSDMLMGYQDPEFFEDNSTLRNWSYVIRQGVTMIKTHWVIVNPIKIANDAVSNNVILAAYGLPPMIALKYQRDGFKYGNEMSHLRSELIDLEFKIYSYGENNPAEKKKIEKKRNDLIKKIQNHPFAPMFQNGMVQSMSTEVLVKDASVVSGLQKDIEKLLNTFLKDEEGKQTAVAAAIQSLARSGFDPTKIIEFAGKGVKEVELLVGLGNNLSSAFEDSSERIKKKTGRKGDIEDGDMAKYISEFIASPDSEAVRLGSYLVQMTDISARYALYKHLMNTRKIKEDPNSVYSEEEAVIKTLEAFVDYKVNMPKELKVMSDYGVILFPSFWLRIQKVIYAIAKDNPLKVAAGITLSELLSLPIETYYGSNIFAKAGNILHQPPVFTDPLDIVAPTDLIAEMLPFV